jgi:hypothetical protein
MKTAIVNKTNYKIDSVYSGSASQSKFGGPWGDSDQFEHVSWDETSLGEQVIAQDNAGSTEIVKSNQNNRNAKLALMRKQRTPKLAECDNMVNDLVTGDRTDTAAVQTYRNDLKNITNTYKDTDPNVGTSALDSFADDLNDFTWPTKP